MFNERILQIENRSFSSIVFAVKGKMVLESKKEIPQSVVTKLICTEVSFCLLRTLPTCVRGSRSYETNINIAETVIKAASRVAILIFVLNNMYVNEKFNKMYCIFEKTVFSAWGLKNRLIILGTTPFCSR